MRINQRAKDILIGLIAYKTKLTLNICYSNKNRIDRNLPCRDLVGISVDLWKGCVENVANNQNPLLTNKDVSNLFLEIAINQYFISDLMVVEQSPYDLIQKTKIKLQEVNKIKKSDVKRSK